MQITDLALFAFREEKTLRFPPRKGGPERWMAPELLMTPCDHSYATDVFSFGFVCLEVKDIESFPQSNSLLTQSQLFTGSIPWGTISDNEAVKKICRGTIPERPDSMMEPLWLLVMRCCDLTPSERPTMTEIAHSLEILL